VLMPDVGTQAYIEVRLVVPCQLIDTVCNFIIENISSGIILDEEEGSAITSITFYVPCEDEKDGRGLLTRHLTNLTRKP